MHTHARTSLNRKLLRLVLGVQLLVAIATLGSAVAVDLRQEKRRLKEIEAQVQESRPHPLERMLERSIGSAAAAPAPESESSSVELDPEMTRSTAAVRVNDSRPLIAEAGK